MGYTKGDYTVLKRLDNEYSVLSVEDSYELARVFIHNGEQEANAHLFKASPRLYKALKAIINSSSLHETGDDTRPYILRISYKAFTKGCEAIKEAEGK